MQFLTPRINFICETKGGEWSIVVAYKTNKCVLPASVMVWPFSSSWKPLLSSLWVSASSAKVESFQMLQIASINNSIQFNRLASQADAPDWAHPRCLVCMPRHVIGSPQFSGSVEVRFMVDTNTPMIIHECIPSAVLPDIFLQPHAFSDAVYMWLLALMASLAAGSLYRSLCSAGRVL